MRGVDAATLIASIYGMNFKIMPELEWTHGYPLRSFLMLFAGDRALHIFKLKEVAVSAKACFRCAA